MVNHKYSTYTLLIIIGLVLTVGVVALLESEDIDEICTTDGNIIKRISGTWQCDQAHYAEVYYHSYSDAVTITITDTDTYYIISNFTMDNTRGFQAVTNGINTTKAGNYSISLQIALSGGNGGQYEIELFKNADAQVDCATFFTGTGATHTTVQVSCIKSLDVGDRLYVYIKDLNNPAQNVEYHQLNFNIHEVG